MIERPSAEHAQLDTEPVRFSSLQIEDWQNFLRIKIDSQGALTIYPIGIDRAQRAWREAGKMSRLARYLCQTWI